jgi:hypothetical protein
MAAESASATVNGMHGVVLLPPATG